MGFAIVELLLLAVIGFIIFAVVKRKRKKKQDIQSGNYEDILKKANEEIDTRINTFYPMLKAFWRIYNNVAYESDEYQLGNTMRGGAILDSIKSENDLLLINQYHPNDERVVALVKKLRKFNNAVDMLRGLHSTYNFLVINFKMQFEENHKKAARLFSQYPNSDEGFARAYLTQHYDDYEPS